MPKNKVIDPWQAEDDARTLRRAIEIQGDTKRMKAAQNVVQKELKALQKVAKKK